MNCQVIVCLVMAFASVISWSPDREWLKFLSNRWVEFKSIPVAERTSKRITEICSTPLLSKGVEKTCPSSMLDWRTFGRPENDASSNCDITCCRKGKLTGFCEGIFKGCVCTDDPRDVLCGPAVSLGAVGCIFDSSRCHRKCCRKQFPDYEGGGRCEGFLKMKCKC